MPILSMHTWVSLSNEMRLRIRNIFNIPRSGHVIVNDGQIETDGTTPQDFASLTVEKMQEYLGDKSDDFYKLFDKVLARVQDEIEGKVIEPIAPTETINANTKKNEKKSK